MSLFIPKCLILLFPNTWLLDYPQFSGPRYTTKDINHLFAIKEKRWVFYRNLFYPNFVSMMNRLLTFWKEIPSHKCFKASFLSLESRSSLWLNNFSCSNSLQHRLCYQRAVTGKKRKIIILDFCSHVRPYLKWSVQLWYQISSGILIY